MRGMYQYTGILWGRIQVQYTYCTCTAILVYIFPLTQLYCTALRVLTGACTGINLSRMYRVDYCTGRLQYLCRSQECNFHQYLQVLYSVQMYYISIRAARPLVLVLSTGTYVHKCSFAEDHFLNFPKFAICGMLNINNSRAHNECAWYNGMQSMHDDRHGYKHFTMTRCTVTKI